MMTKYYKGGGGSNLPHDEVEEQVIWKKGETVQNDYFYEHNILKASFGSRVC